MTAKIWKKSRARGLRIRRNTGEYYIHMKVGGRAVVPSATGTTSESQALLIRDARVKSMLTESTEPVSVNAQPSLTVAELADRYERNLSLLELKPNAMLFRKELLDVFRKTWPDLSMSANKVGGQTLRDWAGKLMHYSPRRFNGFMDTVRYILDLAVESEALRSNPMQKGGGKPPVVRKRKVPRSKYGRDDLLKDEDVQRISDWIRQNGWGNCTYGADLVTFLRYTGLRVSEMATLEKHHAELFPRPVSGIYGWLHVPPLKHATDPRDIPLFEPAFNVVQKWLKICKKKSRSFRVGAHYEKRTAEWLSPTDDAYRAIRLAVKALGIKVHVSHHTFRHLFGTWCFENGVEDMAVAKLMGHQDNGELARATYTHVRKSFVQMESSKLAKRLPSLACAAPRERAAAVACLPPASEPTLSEESARNGSVTNGHE